MEAIQGNYNGKDILAVGQFDLPDIDILFSETSEIRQQLERGQALQQLQGMIMANLFYEPSTRTSSSFAAAVQRLGGGFIPINDVQYSSVSKGENLADTIRTLEQFADIIVLRHPEEGQAEVAAQVSTKPVINAGDGVGEHPTQALLDLYTIRREQGRLEDLTVTMVGDLKNGRTVHSLARLLAMYGVTLNYVAPTSLSMPTKLQDELSQQGISQFQTTDLESVIPTTDVLYVTRVQKERFLSNLEYNAVKAAYTITPQTMSKASPEMVLLHPLPRVGEITAEVDQDPRAAYFRQVANGLYIRMALLSLILGKSMTQ